VGEWIVIVDINGELEQCRFRSGLVALEAVVSLAKDYPSKLNTVVLCPMREDDFSGRVDEPDKRRHKYVN